MKYHEKIAEVYNKIFPYIKRTPVIHSDIYSQKTHGTIFFKCENLQHTHSFKVRGAFNKIISMQESNKALVTASGGNHGLAVSYAAKAFGLKAVVVVPEFVPQFRRDMIQALGGEVVVHGKTMDDLNAKVAEFTKNPHYVYIHPFDDDAVIDGQATIMHELLQDIPELDIVIASIGGGGLVSGIAQYAKSFNPQMKVYGIQTVGADAMSQSLKAGEIVGIPSITSIATSLGATKVTEKTLNRVRTFVDKVVTVTDAEAIKDLKETLSEEKLLVEPASSCNLSALVNGKLPSIQGKKVAVILCGGNFSLEQLKQHI